MHAPRPRDAGRTVHEIFGSPDDLKLCSCMTLFDAVAPRSRRFAP
jgi:uncharacterized protein (DUF1810 family)